MMRVRNTLLALLLLAGLGGYIYFYEYLGEDEREAALRKEKNAVPYEEEAIRSLEIRKPDGAAIKLERAGEVWRITAPLTTPADPERVRSLLGQIGSLRIEDTITDATETERKEYKLDEGATAVRVGAEGQDGASEETDLALGEKTPVGSMRYAARTGSSDVMLLSGGVDGIIGADAASLRLKKLIGIDSWKISAITIDAGGKAIALAKSEGEWKLTQPTPFPADSTKVQTLLGDLQAAEATEFVSEAPDDAMLREFGLSNPSVTVTVNPEGETEPVTLTLGAPAAGGTTYARRSGMAAVATVKPDLLTSLKKVASDPTDLRDHRVAPIDRFLLTGIELTRAAGSIQLLKDEESKWRWGAADGPALPSESVNGVIDAVEALQAVAFEHGNSATSQTPELTLVMKQGGGEEAREEVSVRILPASSPTTGQRRLLSSASQSTYLVPEDLVKELEQRAAAITQPAAPGDTPPGAAQP